MKINKIIIWGLKDTQDTFKYVFDGFFKAWKHLNYDTYWINYVEELKNNNIEFTNCLIMFAETGHHATRPPISKHNIYLLHNADDFETEIISKLGNDNILNFHIYAPCSINRGSKDIILNSKYERFNNTTAYKSPTIIFPWATNLLPHDINENIKNLENIKIEPICGHIGTTSGPWGGAYRSFAQELKKYNIQFISYGPQSGGLVPEEDSINFLKKCMIAPSLQFQWQIENYIMPCRIFKTISYGKMGITNNKYVNELFDNKLIYSSDLTELAKKSIEFENNPNKFELRRELMRNVRDNHTYVSRVNLLINCLKKYKDIAFI